ncbi:MAG: hypothetical protein Ct9H90mP8_1310 [Pseudomonadota bacterium]|nr:MAG: hypothetical protein Ct9H90mP8_1310 [Pseudomonadota bacterium]
MDSTGALNLQQIPGKDAGHGGGIMVSRWHRLQVKGDQNTVVEMLEG